MKINNNIPAVHSVRVLNQRGVTLNKNIEQLSSGERINSAGDDSLGFSVSEKMRTQIGGLVAAGRNAEDATSFIQTTEGFLMGAQDIVRRVKEIAVAAANGIYSPDDRALAQKELVQLVGEVDRIASFASFNGLAMLDGQFSRPGVDGIPTASLFFHLGAGPDQRVQAYIATFSARALQLEVGAGGLSISTPTTSRQAITMVDEALAKINEQRTDLGAYKNRLQYVSKTTAIAVSNFVEAESKIRDTDVAATAVNLSKNLLGQQANIAVLAQANAQAQSVLRLLG